MSIIASVLGTEYNFDYRSNDEDIRLKNCDGYCDETVRLCVADRFDKKEPMDKMDLSVHSKKVMRHEIVHAFLYESGLSEGSDWARNEEIVDWIARQFPKMLKVMKEVECI